MEENTPLIYGLEFQARALASQLAESDTIRFIVGTQSIKFNNNQVHVVDLNEDDGSLATFVYQHSDGELWSIATSPTDQNIIATCYNSLVGENVCTMKSAIWQVPDAYGEGDSNKSNQNLIQKCVFDTEKYGQEIKSTIFHPSDGYHIVNVIDNCFVQWDLSEGNPKVVSSSILEGRGSPKFTTGKWNPHHNCTQFVTANYNHIRGWDLRSSNQTWILEGAHSQLIRDFDFNPNKQYIIASCGDDGYSKFWDIRNATEPLMTRSDHSHWIWCIRYNHFHDQLVLTSSSDFRVILTSVTSISSDYMNNFQTSDDASTGYQKVKLEDGVLAAFEEHEDSVYCVEWSSADPWTFASLSYDGRLVINKVSRDHKYKILL